MTSATQSSGDPQQSRLARLHPKAYLTVHLLVGALFTGALVWGFALLADEIPEQGWMVHSDTALTAFIQAHGTEWGEVLFYGISLLGSVVLGLAVAGGAVTFVRKGH